MEFLSEYGLFLLETATVVVAVLVILGGLFRFSGRGRSREPGRLTVKPLNRAFESLADAIRAKALPRSAFKRELKQRKAERKARAKEAATAPRRRVYVLEFDGDLKASGVKGLRREVTAVLAVAQSGDEVLVRLDSSGGFVHAYGLAASQLERVKAAGVGLTVAIDKIAASGGYMMACVADRILAAPFAVVGSIGVVATVPNFNRLLKRHDVDVELHTAGEYKRTLTVIGENTDEGRAKFKEQLADTHALFKTWVERHRSDLDVDAVATGEHWYGAQALERGLVDELKTSDDYLLEATPDADLFEVRWRARRSLGDRVSSLVADTVSRVTASSWDAAQQSRYP